MPAQTAPIDGTTTSAEPRSNAALLTDRTFGPYFAGNLLSNAGNWIQNIAAATAVFNLTGSASLTGVVSGALWIGSLVLQPYAGALSDRVDRRRLLILGQGLAFLAAAALALWTSIAGIDSLPGPWPIIGLTVVIGVGQALAIPASQALIPALVERRDLDGAIALNSLTYTLGRSIGPVAAAGILLLGGPTAGFAVNAVTFLPFLLALLLIHPREVDTSGSGDGSIREGLRYVRTTAGMTGVMLAIAAIGWTSDPINTLSPAVAERLGGGDALVGLFVGAFGAGAAAAGVAVTRARRALGGDALARWGLTVFGVGVAAFGLVPTTWGACAALVVAGVGFLAALTSLTTVVQQVVPEDLRGRVMALWGVAFLGVRPFVAVLDGAIADLSSPQVAVVLAAVPVLLASRLVPSMESGG